MTISTQWDGNNFDYDFCFLTMRDSADGYLGWKANYDPSEYGSFTSLGYPGNFGTGNNDEMFEAFGAEMDDSISGDHGQVEMSCEQMHSGNSGGPWQQDNYVLSVNSHHFGGDGSSSVALFCSTLAILSLSSAAVADLS